MRIALDTPPEDVVLRRAYSPITAYMDGREARSSFCRRCTLYLLFLAGRLEVPIGRSEGS